MDIEAPSAKAPDNVSNVSGKLTLQLQVPEIKYKVVAEYPHDRNAYTEGLKFYEGYLYESTGKIGGDPSTLRRVELETGAIIDSVPLNNNYFGEGLTILRGKIFQLTQDSQVGLIYDVNDLQKPPVEFEYKGWMTGWGLTDDGQLLIMSDGTDKLRFINPETMELAGEPMHVRVNSNSCDLLNELERVGNFIYSNILYSDFLVRIRNDGNVIGQIDVSALRPKETLRCVDCIPNGIAHDSTSGHLFITGKMWPKLFRLSLYD